MDAKIKARLNWVKLYEKKNNAAYVCRHLNRESLYKTLSSKGNPRFQTMGLLLKGLGFHLVIEPANI